MKNETESKEVDKKQIRVIVLGLSIFFLINGWPKFQGIHINWTMMAVFTALFGYFLSDWLRRRPSESNLRVVGKHVYPQERKGDQVPDYYGRLVIYNDSQYEAEYVEAYVENIVDDGRGRVGFLPVPLNWTHIDNDKRSISGGQTVYLDIFGFEPRNGNRFRLTTRIQGIDLFDRLHANSTLLFIKFYQKSGQILPPVLLSINYDGKSSPNFV